MLFSFFCLPYHESAEYASFQGQNKSFQSNYDLERDAIVSEHLGWLMQQKLRIESEVYGMSQMNLWKILPPKIANQKIAL